jgi:hypothetical protein
MSQSYIWIAGRVSVQKVVGDASEENPLGNDSEVLLESVTDLLHLMIEHPRASLSYAKAVDQRIFLDV